MLPPVAASPPAVRRDAGGLPGSDGLVVSHGVGTRRRLHGAAVGAADDGRCRRERRRARGLGPGAARGAGD